MTPQNVSKVTGIGTIERCSHEYPSGREKKFQTAGHVSFRCGAAKPRGIEAASLGKSSWMLPLPGPTLPAVRMGAICRIESSVRCHYAATAFS